MRRGRQWPFIFFLAVPVAQGRRQESVTFLLSQRLLSSLLCMEFGQSQTFKARATSL